MLKRSDGKQIVKKKDSDIVNDLYEDEKGKQDSDRGDRIVNAFDISNSIDRRMVKVKVSDLYAAPTNEEWNDFPKLSPDKEYELHQSIIDGGLMTPIIVWDIPKSDVVSLYKDNIDEYGFIGDKYMVIAGHSRTNAFIKLYNETKDEQYLYIDAIVRKNLTQDAAKYIIKITNYVNRDLTAKAKRVNMEFLHKTLMNNKTRGMNVAKKIAEDSGSKLRTVQYYISINENLIPEFKSMYDDELITQVSAIKLARLTMSLQKWMHDEYKDMINNNTIRGIQPSYTKKEQIKTIFEKNEEVEYTNISVEIPKDKEKKFRKMVENWKVKHC